MKKKNMIATATAAVLAVVMLGGGTAAYLYDESTKVTNTISGNYNFVDLYEDVDGDEVTETENSYEIIPGTSAVKNPTVDVNYTLDSYVYITLDENVEYLVEFSIDTSVWTALDGYDNVWYRLVTTEDVTGTEISGSIAKLYSQTLNVLTDGVITYSKDLTNSDMYVNGKLISDMTMVFQAYIVQATLSDSDNGYADPAAAYPVARGASSYDASGATVFAEITDTDGDGEITAADVSSAIKAAGATPTAFVLSESITIDDADNAIYVAEDQTISITLADGVMIQSTVSGVSAIENSGVLEVSGGTVDATEHATAAVSNNAGATLTLSGVTVTRSQEAGSSATDSNGNSYYYIDNQGDLTLEGCTIESSGAYSSLIHNGWYDGTKNTTGATATLTINSGTYSGGINTVKNDDYGVLVINGGTFTDTSQYAVMNWNVATINGGTFTSTAMASVSNAYADATMDQGVLYIYGGTFTSAGSTGIGCQNSSSGYGTIVVCGGTWNTEDILPSGFSGTSNSFTVTDNGDGTYTVSPTAVTSTEELEAALENASENAVIVVSGTVSLTDTTTSIANGTTIVGNGADETTLVVSENTYTISSDDVTISNLTIAAKNMNSQTHVLTVTGSGTTIDNVVITGGANKNSANNASIYVTCLSEEGSSFTITNSAVSGAGRAIWYSGTINGDLIIDNCTLEAIYPFNFGSVNGTVTVTNSTLKGWTSYGSGSGSVTFTDCVFEKGSSGYDNIAPYTDTTFTNCSFDSEFYFIWRGGTYGGSGTITFTSCTIDGVELTSAEQLEEILEDVTEYTSQSATSWCDYTFVINGTEISGSTIVGKVS